MRERRQENENTAQFTKIGTAGGLTGYQCGRTVFCTAGQQAADVQTAAQTWEMETGSYLFLGEALKPDAASEFLISAVWLLKSCGGNILFGWICNPNIPMRQWKYQLLLRESGSGDAHRLLTGREFDWQRYALFLPGGSRMVLDDFTAEKENALTASERAQREKEASGETAVRLETAGKKHWLRTPGITLYGEGKPELWLTGEDAGVWEVDFLLPGEPDIFARIDAGIRYDSMQGGQPYRATAALFRPGQDMRLRGRLDFAKEPEEGMQFFFDESVSFEIPCDIPTLYGRRVYARMRFSTGGADAKTGEEERPGLVFAKGIRWFTTEGGKLGAASEYYLTYTGRFDLRIEADIPTACGEERGAAPAFGGEVREAAPALCGEISEDAILCGRMGTEYLRCGAAGLLPICFHPGKPAYCALDGKAEGLGEIATTAWISFGTSEEAVSYYSSAAQTALYTIQERTSELLAYLELPVAQLAGETAVPVLPVKQLSEETTEEELLLGMELAGILPTRTRLLLDAANVIENAENTERIAMTPQGWLVGVLGNTWNWIGLAANHDKEVPDSGFAGMSKRLQMEFHDSRLFLPMADFAAVSAEVQHWKLDFAVGDWRFLVDAEHLRGGREDKSNTAIIFKYAKDKTIDKLMEETDFKEQRLAGDIAKIYQSAAARAYDRDGNVLADYRNFHEIIHDPAFSGVLVLNCPLLADRMPEELKLLLAGLDGEALYAHHMGIHANDIIVKDGSLVMKRSSYFGMVDYQDNGALVNEDIDGKDYDFLTKRVLLEIRNSAIVQFAAEAEVLINRLFDTKAQAVTGEAGNCLVLDGSYQNSGGLGQYVFALRQSTVLALKGSMPETVEVSAVRMKAWETDGMLTGSFGLTGKLRFLRDAACDIPAYGSDPDTGEDGYLAFDGLMVDMSMELAGAKEKHFAVRYETLTLDEAQSVPRRSSLPACLPAHPQALLRYNLSEGTPKTLGYRSMTCPVEQGEIKSQWYGLFYTVPLGSPGANAAVEVLELKLLYAWGMPGEAQKNPPVFVGIMLPGLGADGVTLNLQGILKLDFKSVEMLVYYTEEKTDYQLCFRNFTLSALGMSFPPGKNNIYLFGENGSGLGWYAAYQKEENDGGKGEGDHACSRAGDEQSD